MLGTPPTNQHSFMTPSIDDQKLDILLLTERNIALDAPAAMKNGTALDGFQRSNAHGINNEEENGCWDCNHTHKLF